MNDIFGFVSLIVLGCGIYTLYAYIKMKKTGEINEILLLGNAYVAKKCKNKKGSVYSFDDYSRMCLNQDKLDGIIINPYHKERSIVLNKDVIQHIRTIKEKNIKTYAKAKSYLKDRKRRQKYEIDYES